MTQHLRSELRVAQDPALFGLAARMQNLTDDDWGALARVPVVHRFIGRGRAIIDEGEDVRSLRVICKGWALRYSHIDTERRHILDVDLPGDVLGLRVDGRGRATAQVDALTACEVGEIDIAALREVALERPVIALGLSALLARELVRAEDHSLRLGRMTAYERVCSFLLETYERQRELAPTRKAVDCHVTQTLVADVLGLSVVHVNRQIMRLRREGAISLTRRTLEIHDRKRLEAVCGYRARHLGDPRQVLAKAS